MTEGAEILKIANVQAFWGDNPGAAERMALLEPELDYLTLDYLAELSLSIMANQREKDLNKGYAADFINVVHSLIPFWNRGHKLKIVTNAGGLNPKGLARSCLKSLKESKTKPLKIAVVEGDDVLDKVQQNPNHPLFNNLETNEPIESIKELVTANAYLGAKPIEQALQMGADIVITGRVADPSLTVGPCMAHFGWDWKDYDKIAQATIAGHLIECGTQATGGISTNWLSILNPADMGFPVVEISSDASFVITKPPYTGGFVNLETIKEQLLYEIGDPNSILTPDATVSILKLEIEEIGKDRVQIKGAAGRAPTETYKVSATYKAGFKAESYLTIAGKDCVNKALKCGDMIFERVRHAGFALYRTHKEALGSGDAVPGIHKVLEIPECVLRIAAEDPRIEALECFVKHIAPLVTAGPQGVTGYAGGRAKIRPVYGYWPCLIEKNAVRPHVYILGDES